MQATLNRSQDVQYFASQQALLQKQLAELTLTARKLRAEGAEFQDGLRKKRLKLQQEVEVVFTQPCPQPECKHNLGVNAVMLFGPCTEAIAASRDTFLHLLVVLLRHRLTSIVCLHSDRQIFTVSAADT